MILDYILIGLAFFVMGYSWGWTVGHNYGVEKVLLDNYRSND